MKIRILGSSGGIYQHMATTSFLVDDDILIDAGTGVGELLLDEMHQLRHIFITHSHLDHIAAIPLLIDSIFDELIARPIRVHALPETIMALRHHIFNWAIWPDFTLLPDNESAVLKLEAMNAGDCMKISGRDIRMVAVNHSVPGVGYFIESQGKVFAYSGDTGPNDSLWESLNKYESIDLLIAEAAFADRDIELARKSGHYCPQLLAEDLRGLKHKTKIYITHLKPGYEEEIMAQCRFAMPDREVLQLKSGDVFHL